MVLYTQYTSLIFHNRKMVQNNNNNISLAVKTAPIEYGNHVKDRYDLWQVLGFAVFSYTALGWKTNGYVRGGKALSSCADVSDLPREDAAVPVSWGEELSMSTECRADGSSNRWKWAGRTHCFQHPSLQATQHPPPLGHTTITSAVKGRDGGWRDWRSADESIPFPPEPLPIYLPPRRGSRGGARPPPLRPPPPIFKS